MHGLMKEIEKNPAVSIVDIIDHRGYTLMHMACFKNLEEIGQVLM
jgi:ankyrin repeat protein